MWTSFDLQQGFADVKIPIDRNASVTMRGGRQEIRFGRLVDVRESPNIRLSFDGGRVFYESSTLRLDAFGAARSFPSAASSMTIPTRGCQSPATAFWGLYGVVPIGAVPGLHIDPYYFGIIRKNAPYDSGVADETRHTMSTRVWGRAAAWDYDIEGIFQFGDFGTRKIRAWSMASDTGYTIANLWGQPRLGLRGDVASSGGSGRTLKSFNPLFRNSPISRKPRSIRRSTTSTSIPRLPFSRGETSPSASASTCSGATASKTLFTSRPEFRLCPTLRTRSGFSVQSSISRPNGKRPHKSPSTPLTFTS